MKTEERILENLESKEGYIDVFCPKCNEHTGDYGIYKTQFVNTATAILDALLSPDPEFDFIEWSKNKGFVKCYDKENTWSNDNRSHYITYEAENSGKKKDGKILIDCYLVVKDYEHYIVHRGFFPTSELRAIILFESLNIK